MSSGIRFTIGALIVSGALIGAFVEAPLAKLLLMGIGALAGAGLIVVLLNREDSRIRTEVAKISEHEAVAIAKGLMIEKRWTCEGKETIRLRFSDHPPGAGPAWEITWKNYRSSIWVWIDVQTGKVLGVSEPLPR